jgi:hypothetical protein
MILDDQNRYADSQTIALSGASTDLIDHSQDRNIGSGEPMSVVITLEAIAKGSVGDETYQVRIETDDAVGFPSASGLTGYYPIVRLSPAGSMFVLPMPKNDLCERFTRLGWLLGGTGPTVTYSAYLVPTSMVPAEAHYPDAIDFG